MADRWLDALQKTENASRVPPTPVADPLLAAMFGAAEDDVLIAPEKMDKVHDDGFADVLDPVAQFVSKLMQGAAHVPEIAPRHADGVELEKSADGLWKYTWQGGRMIKSELNGKVITDESEKPLYITNELAKVIGLDSDSMHADVGLAGFVPDLDLA